MCFSIEINRDLKYLSEFFNAKIDKKSFLLLEENFKKDPNHFKRPAEDNRVFPNYYAPFIIMGPKSQKMITPMRYRIRPSGSEKEVPSKYNLFNARLDSLYERKTWKDLIGKNHGIIPFVKFFEWITAPSGKKMLISFSPQNRELMWSPCLFDQWSSKNGENHINSFALITTDPQKEVLKAGHDRNPIFLPKNEIDLWLSPEKLTKTKILGLLSKKEDVFYLAQNENL